MKFIKLTELLRDGTAKTIIINFEQVQYLVVGMRGKDTHIRMFDKSFFFVRESIDDIWDKLGNCKRY